MAHSQKGRLVGNGKGSMTKPNTPMGFAPRAQDPVRFGRGFHMQDHMVFGLVTAVFTNAYRGGPLVSYGGHGS